jgi:DNA polymerase elongation subunit (family B)
MNTYIIDIETAPLSKEEIAPFIPEFKADSRLKDPVKVAEDLRSKEASFYDKCTLSALTSKVCAIGIWEIGKEEPELYCGMSEEKLINIFSDLLVYFDGADGMPGGRAYNIITFNGNNFDIPFLCRRGLKYGKNLFTKFFRTDGGFAYDSGSIDLAAMWDCRRKDYTSLKELALHLGVGDKDKSEELFYQTYERDPEAAKAYLRNDLLLTKKIAEKWQLIPCA